MSLRSILNNTAVKLLCCVSEPLMGIFISIMKQLKIYKKNCLHHSEWMVRECLKSI